MAYDIVTIGALLCEVMRKDLDKPLEQTADFSGPYPSGDAAIMLNAAAKLGSNCAMIGVVDDDGFGRCVTNRLTENGVDCSMVRVEKDASSGVAFVCYFGDGSRNFLFHVRQAAPGLMNEDDIDMQKLKDAKWIHITGFTMSISDSSAKAICKLIENFPAETKVSFDPNIRADILSVEEIKTMCQPVLDRANLIFPSKSEAVMFTGCSTDKEGCKLWADQGKLVVLKNGEDGCRIFSKDSIIDIPTFSVEEVDPTGAGDTFCGAFLAALLEEMPLEQCARFANAAGAMSVRKLGPMEGAPSRAELELFLEQHT